MSTFSIQNSYVTVQKAQRIETLSASSVVPLMPALRLFSCFKFTMDPGGKSSYMKGAGIVPIDIVPGTAEAKLDVECSNAMEVRRACKLVGGIGGSCVFTINFIRTGMTPMSYLFLPSLWENGGGFDVDDTGAKDKLSIKFTDCFENGLSIYNKLA